MAKNTHSQEVLTGTSDSYTEAELQDPLAMLRHRPVLEGNSPDAGGGDGVSVGNNSEASSGSESPENDSQTHNPQADAPAAENPSNPEHPESDTAPLTDGSGQETEPQRSVSPPRKATKAVKSTRPSRAKATEDDDF